MTEDKSISLINLGKLSKPADTLIKKVSSAVGGIFEPWQIKRVAKAEAEADLIFAKSEIEITGLHRRAMHRFVEEEAIKQQNMEKITRGALPQLNDGSDPSAMDDDWVTNFFDKSRIISDEEMQGLWSNILAGEANAPGTYSKRTVNFLGDLNKKDAEFFQSICSFGWIIGKFTPLVFEADAQIYNDHGVNFETLAHLDAIGLIQFSHVAGFRRTGLSKSGIVFYYGKPLVLTMEKEAGNDLPIGRVLLTKVGEELATVCKAPSVKGFEDYTKEKWAKYIPQEVPTVEIVKEN